MHLNAMRNNETPAALREASSAPPGKRRAVAVIIPLRAKGGVSTLASRRRSKKERAGRPKGRLLAGPRGRPKKIL